MKRVMYCVASMAALGMMVATPTLAVQNYIRANAPISHNTEKGCGTANAFPTPAGVEFGCQDVSVNVTFETNGDLGPKHRSDSYVDIRAEDTTWHLCGIHVLQFGGLGGGTALAITNDEKPGTPSAFYFHAAAVTPGSKAAAHVSVRWFRFTKDAPSNATFECNSNGFQVTPFFWHKERFQQNDYAGAGTYHQCTWTHTDDGHDSLSCT